MRKQSSHPAMPIALQLTGRRAVVVGDGPRVSARIRRLEDGGAHVDRIASADYRAEVCAGAFVVMANSDDDQLNRRVAADARAAGCLAYAHDAPDVSDFAMPAIAQRGRIKVAVSTDGTAPTMSRRLREQLTELFDAAGDQFDALVAAMVERRSALAPGERARVLYQMASRLRVDGELVIAPEE